VTAKEPNALLFIVGGTQKQVSEYYALARSAGIENQCVFTGRVSQSKAKYYTELGSVLLSPRSEGTNTPLKIYEELASGIPLVATRIYSHTQVLDDNVAFLVEPEPESMARGIVAALQNHGEAARIGANAKRLYQEKYTRAVYVEKMKQVLEKLG
jgi:glycosyltransferase involved in cell wall biosynthesis